MKKDKSYRILSYDSICLKFKIYIRDTLIDNKTVMKGKGVII